ncbi:MAG: GNAT family N-acetyltransferase [Halobacteria archaeon]
MLRVRLFRPEDFSRVVAIERAAFAEDYAPLFIQLYEMASDGFYVAEADGLVVGYIVAALAEDQPPLSARDPRVSRCERDGSRASPQPHFASERESSGRLLEGRIFSLAVDPAHRKRGVAAALLQRALDLYRAEGISAVRLEVRMDNGPAQALYRRFGFEPAGRLPGYYSDGVDALVMRRAEAGLLPGPKPLPFPIGLLQKSPHG